MWPFKSQKLAVGYGTYDAVERMCQTLDHIEGIFSHVSDALDDILGELESCRSELEHVGNGTDNLEAIRDAIKARFSPPQPFKVNVNSLYGKGLVSEQCPYCHTQIYGTKSDIDSGLRKHIEYCDEAQKELEHEQAESAAQMAHDEMINSEYLDRPEWGDQ